MSLKMASSGAMPAKPEIPMMDDRTLKCKKDHIVGKSFSTFADGSHPFSSQTRKDCNLKRVGRKYSSNTVDISKFEYRDARSQGNGKSASFFHGMPG